MRTQSIFPSFALVSTLALTACTSSSPSHEQSSMPASHGAMPASQAQAGSVASDQAAEQWAAESITSDNADAELEALEREIQGDG